MTPNACLQLGLYLAVLFLLAWPLSGYMHRVYAMERAAGWLRPIGALERLVYRTARVDADSESGWKAYARAMLTFNGLGILALSDFSACSISFR